VANLFGGTVTEYVPSDDPNATPARTIAGPATGISGPSGVAVAPPLVIRTTKLHVAHIGRPYRTHV
jgi:hypothetical protein